MEVSKQRLEAFTDGVVAIIITIMVLSIPLPESFGWGDLLEFGSSLFIYLLSFLVVGAFWNQHQFAFMFLEKVNQKIIASNIFFLFFLSLIPIFTKWVLQNQGSLIPVIGYDIVYVLVSLLYVFTFRLIIEESEHKSIKKINEKIKSKRESKPSFSWAPFIVLLILVSIVVIISIYLPKLSTFILMGIPIASSLFNLFVSQQGKWKRRLPKENH